MEKLNKDEIYLICKKLNINSTLNFSLANRRLRNTIFLHDTLLREKLKCPMKRCHHMVFQIRDKVNILCDGFSK